MSNLSEYFYPHLSLAKHELIDFDLFWQSCFSSFILQMDDREFPIEAFYQRQVSHPNVIQLLEIFKHRDYFVFVLERPQNFSDLFDYLNERLCLTEDEGRQLFTNILDATIQCEKQGVIHRDIKPENIIVDLSKMEAKLTDFGLACDVRVTPFRCFVGKTRTITHKLQ